MSPEGKSSVNVVLSYSMPLIDIWLPCKKKQERNALLPSNFDIVAFTPMSATAATIYYALAHFALVA